MIIRLAFSVFEGSLGSQYIDGKHLFSSIKEIPKCLRIVIHWLLINFSLLLIIASFICFQVVSYVLLTLFRMSFFGAAHGWGGGGAQKDPLPKICQTYPAMFKLGAVIPYPKKIQKIYESRDTSLELCWHPHFFTRNQQILLYQEIRI